jgi:hypothetical protein
VNRQVPQAASIKYFDDGQEALLGDERVHGQEVQDALDAIILIDTNQIARD